MSSINKEIVLFIENNNNIDSYLNGIDILLKLLENVLNEPQNLKYRKIRLENKLIRDKLISLNGMKNLLLTIGFQNENNKQIDGTEYVLPSDTLLAKIKNYRDFIIERKTFFLNQTKKKDSNLNNTEPVKRKIFEPVYNSYGNEPEACCSKQNRNVLSIQPSKPYIERITFSSVLTTNNGFLKSIESHSDQVMQYEDEKLLKHGKLLIPLERLTYQALQRLRTIQKNIQKNSSTKLEDPCIRDLLLIELTNWFSQDFFQWINKMPCKICKNNSKNLSTIIENNVRIEITLCCGIQTKFYRFNDVVDLLKTRRGRCGEYANCFTFFCRCLDYDARLVFATFDHVWTEVYSTKQKRWLHIDPSDNIIDSPLMYQHGWNRNVDYVFAYSRDDLQDVTWRYTNDFNKILLQRKHATEAEILRTFDIIRLKRQRNVSVIRKKYIKKRTLNELVELLISRNPTINEKKGRSSGSMEWRLERGEQSLNNFYVFEATDHEKDTKQFNLRYSCSNNKYERYLNDSNKILVKETYSDWESVHFSSINIFRKIEKDWQMAYLCRQENSDFGEIIWKFNFQSTNLFIKNFELKINRETFENGEIDIKLYDLNDQLISDIRSLNGFYLKIKLYGGVGDVAWQHSQLFRQKLSSNEFPFILNLEFH